MKNFDSKKFQIAIGIVFLGIFLFAGALTFGTQSSLILWSDGISGLFLIIFGLLSISKERKWSGWAVCIVGLWLQFAPLIFWATNPANYFSDTFIGMLAIILAFLLQGFSGLETQNIAEMPLGWSYNPSAWLQRGITVGLAMLCWFFARYMAAYQLGYLDSVWDPVFGDGTLKVITSKVSKMCPVPDAGLGALVYSMEFLMGWQGDSRRWHTMPWLVLTFGLFVVPAGIVSIFLIISQPVFVGAWCFLCLLTALCMLIMITMTVAEVVAALQFLFESRKKGKSLWKTLWFGGTPEKTGGFEKKLPGCSNIRWGITIPWNLVVNIFIGFWLICEASLYTTQVDLIRIQYIVGPLLITFSMISMAEAIRAVRYVNILLAALLIIAPWFLLGATQAEIWNSVLTAVAIILLCLRKGKIKESYGSWDKFIF